MADAVVAIPAPLPCVPLGERRLIHSITHGHVRLRALGLRPGVELMVHHHLAQGSLVIGVGSHRLGLDQTAAAAILTLPCLALIPSGASMPLTLSAVPIGTAVRILGYAETTTPSYKRKLLAMGLTPGSTLRVTRHAPLGDPTEIEIRGCALSVRRHEADVLQLALVAVEEQ